MRKFSTLPLLFSPLSLQNPQRIPYPCVERAYKALFFLYSVSTMADISFNNTRFIVSAPYLRSLPPDQGMEFAFAGRSNAGKSSALNALTGRKSLAKTSGQPGKTQHINLFEVQPGIRIADLPGYGYAKVPPREKKRWEEEMTLYILHRECLKGIVLLMDIRHPLTELDRAMINLAVRGEREIHFILSKSDKLKANARNKTLMEMNNKLRGLTVPWSIQTLSTLKKEGVKELKQHLNFWYNQGFEE